ncbi:hypothetical protein DPMN_077824 [Dreissena polymorpha]|uniref:Uncharacterized protein n=1 Tax=Dreissena polymorpha TaxID=45954 RepID=A0A9D4BPP4_DREPO|nr:hypothetical protein DPMN_077824 [Dreissena polymorpha]
MPAEVEVIMLYTVLPPSRVPTNSYAVNVHITNGQLDYFLAGSLSYDYSYTGL